MIVNTNVSKCFSLTREERGRWLTNQEKFVKTLALSAKISTHFSRRWGNILEKNSKITLHAAFSLDTCTVYLFFSSSSSFVNCVLWKRNWITKNYWKDYKEQWEYRINSFYVIAFLLKTTVSYIQVKLTNMKSQNWTKHFTLCIF